MKEYVELPCQYGNMVVALEAIEAIASHETLANKSVLALRSGTATTVSLDYAQLVAQLGLLAEDNEESDEC